VESLSGGGYAASMFFGNSGSADFDFYVDAAATFDAAGRMTAITDLGLGFYALGAGGSHADFGTDGILAWGRWIGPVTGDYCGDGCVLNENYSANQGFHYVIGMPTASMPQSGVATYTLLGATRPTYVDGILAPGTLTGSLTVDFGKFTVGTNLNVTMPDTTYAIRGDATITGAVFTGTTANLLSVSGGGCASSSCDAFVAGFFAGTSAERAGLGYHISDFGTGKDVVGAAAFKKQ